MTNPVHEFASLAERYCLWASSEPQASDTDDAEARTLLPLLYLAAQRLPEGRAAEADLPLTPPDTYARVCRRFASLSVGYYGDTFDPLVVPPEEAVVSHLQDDLADIHGDLRRGLDLFREGHQEAAAWEWRFSFMVHWGAHLVGALRALHHSWTKTHPPY